MTSLPEHIVSKIMSYVSHPVADIFSSKFDEWEYARCYECPECRNGGEGPCTCPVFHASEIESLYLVSPPSYKMEKMLEAKVIMNWVVSKIGNHQVNPDLSMEKRIVYHRWLWGGITKKKILCFVIAIKILLTTA